MNFNQRLSQLAGRLNTSSARWDNAERDISQSDRYIDMADRGFNDAERASRWAESDTPRTDSSWHGRDIQRGMRDGTRNVDWAENEVRRGDSEVRQLNQELGQADGELDALIADMKAANDQRVALVEAASRDLNGSQDGFGRVGNELRHFDSSARFLDMSARRAEHDTWQIVNDRPGRDVSMNAWQVSNSLRDIERNLSQMDRNLYTSTRVGDQADTQLDAAIAKLNQAAQG